MNQSVLDSTARHGNHDDAEYHSFLARVSARFMANARFGAEVLFTTDAENMWGEYLDQMVASERQYHNCHACRQFIERFGNLVTIDSNGVTSSAFWNEEDAPDNYIAPIIAMRNHAGRAKVTGVFLSRDKIWGTPKTGAWHHFGIVPPSASLFYKSIQTPGQGMAEKAQDFQQVMRALAEFTPPMIDQAVLVLRSDAMFRSEKVLGQAEWLQALHTARGAVRGPAKDNVVWRAAASAPAGFCHPRSSTNASRVA